jgi:hypothetical protein
MAFPLVPVIVYGGGSLLAGSASYGIYKGASEGAKDAIKAAALVGVGYLIYKRAKR